MDPSAARVLKWNGQGTPRVSSVPSESPGDQPLYGLGVAGLKPVYITSDADSNKTCFVDNFFPESCVASTRNNPGEGWIPAFTVFPLNAAHVQTAVKFAKKHNLCVSVAGTGHDYVNRHSCPDGLFIRTTLLKNSSVDLTDSRGFGHTDGNIRFGAGIVFDEAHKVAADAGRIVSSGWASTVGIVGWALGGGHGPIVPSAGMGADNLLEIELVNADGEIVVANARNNSDLWWALRGGGGSTWGVVTAVTVKAHKIPSGGLTRAHSTWEGVLCAPSSPLDAILAKHQSWAQTLDTKWGGFFQLTLVKLDDATASFAKCKTGFRLDMDYVYAGQNSTAEFISTWGNITSVSPPKEIFQPTFATWSQQLLYQGLESIIPIWIYRPQGLYQGSIPSAVVSRELVASGALLEKIRFMISECRDNMNCNKVEVYQDLTGNLGSPKDANVSLSPGMRNGFMHFLFAGQWNEQAMRGFYALGNNSYFAESAYLMSETTWKDRYWGSNYPNLLQVKNKYDPEGRFWCYHCVGDVDKSTGTGTPTATATAPVVTTTSKPGAGHKAVGQMIWGLVAAIVALILI